MLLILYLRVTYLEETRARAALCKEKQNLELICIQRGLVL